MGRNIGTNVYSNNFEPQVNGLLDARGQAATKADLTTTAQWISTDGNIYAPKAILVAVTDDPIASNNGLYMLKGNDYSVASNWMQINVENTPSNVKVLTTANLINSSRTNAVQLSSTDVSTLRSATDKDVFVYNGVLGGMTTTIPMTITFTSSPATALQMVISYAFVDKTFYIAVSATDTSQKDVLYADVPREMANGGGGSLTSNVKLLTTPQLLDTTRTTGSIELSAADAAILTGLSVGKDMVFYSGMSGVASQFIPLSVNMVGSGNAKVFLVSFAFYNSLYYFNINGGVTSNKYTAGAINRAEGSGGGESEVEIINLSEIAAVNDTNLTASESLKTEFEKLYDVVTSTKIPFANWFDNIEGKYPISIKDDSGTNTTFSVLFNNELWEVDYDHATSTYSTKKVEDSGASSEGAYLTTLDLWGTITSDPLYQNEYDEIVNIYNKYKAGIPVVISMRDHYQGTLNIHSNYGGITDRSTITFTIIYGDYVESWSVLMKVGSSWERTYKKLPTEISLYDIVANNATDLTTSDGEELYDSIIMLDSLKRDGSPIYASGFDSLTGHHPISIRDTFSSFVVNYSGREFQIDYQINGNKTITYSVTDVTKHDLSIDVRINRDKLSKKQTVQYRIRELVTNGYICFLRKKKCSNSHVDYRRNKYTVPLLSFSRGYKIRALDVFAIPCNKVKLNEWTDFPNFDDFIATSDNVLKQFLFKGNVHANPCRYNFATGVVDKHTSVLNCGLQYLVLNPNFVNGVLENNLKPNDVLKAGDMVKFKVRLHCVNDNNYLSGYKLIYSMD